MVDELQVLEFGPGELRDNESQMPNRKMTSFMTSSISGLKSHDTFGWTYESVVRKDHCWYLLTLKLSIDLKTFSPSMDTRASSSSSASNWLTLGALEDSAGDSPSYTSPMGWVAVQSGSHLYSRPELLKIAWMIIMYVLRSEGCRLLFRTRWLPDERIT